MLIPLLVALLVGVAVMVVGGALSALRSRTRLQRQLKTISAPLPSDASASELFRRRTVDLPEWMRDSGLGERVLARIELRLEQADVRGGARGLLRTTAAVGIVAAVSLVLATGSLLIAVAATGAVSTLPYLRVKRRREARLRRFEEQLPEALGLMSRSIRAGHTVQVAMKLVAEDGDEPLASEFQRVFDEQRYGLPLEDALEGLARRIDLVDVRVMTAAIIVQREVGGNLAEILDGLAELIRERFNLRRQLRTFTAQGRLSGYVLALIPFGVAGVLSLMNPSYLLPLFTDPLGQTVLGGALILQVVGYFWIRKVLQVAF